MTAAATLALRLKATPAKEVRLAGQQRGEVMAEPVDAAFQRVVEHIGHHGHATAHPLAGTAEFRVVELLSLIHISLLTRKRWMLFGVCGATGLGVLVGAMGYLHL